MSALPEVYRLPSIQEGFRNPNLDALEAALPPEDEAPYADLRLLAPQLYQVSEAMPGAGLQGTFGYIYASLTEKLADGIHDRRRNPYLPEINQPEQLEIQAWYFAKTWIDPIRNYVKWRKAVRGGTIAEQQEALEAIPPQWLYTFDTPEVQFSRPVVQFGAGGMGPHIVAGHDLRKSCLNSGVDDEYMFDTYDVVDKYIKQVTFEKSPELLEGNKVVVRAAAAPVAVAIAGLRKVARNGYYQAKKEEDPLKREAMFDKADYVAVGLSKAVVKLGGFALDVFDVTLGPNAWYDRFRRPAKAVDASQQEAA